MAMTKDRRYPQCRTKLQSLFHICWDFHRKIPIILLAMP